MTDASVIQRRRFGSKFMYGHADLRSYSNQLVEVSCGRAFNLKHELLQQAKAKIALEFGFNAETCCIEFHAYANEIVRTATKIECKSTEFENDVIGKI